MKDVHLKRLSRLTAMLTILQTKRVITSSTLAEKFGVSIRTIYRDIRALEQAGVPVIAEERKGYTLMEGYRIPPVMFTENEANALITVEQLVHKNSDSSLIKEYSQAISKIKAVLLYATKDKTDLLATRTAVSLPRNITNLTNSLMVIQNALTDFKVLKITYYAEQNSDKTQRTIEPFALYYTLEGFWTLIAFCHLRNDFRMFRLDKITTLETKEQTFKPHRLTLKEFLDAKEKNFKIPDTPLS